jgi:hypothetical protein
MKKLTTLLLIAVTTLVLTACGGGGGDSTTDSRDPTPTTSGTGSFLLSWVAPSTRADGSYLPLTELEGYRVYYGTSANNLSVLVDLNDDSLTEYSVDTLPSGNYYFAVTAYDSNGVESGLSNILNKDV